MEADLFGSIFVMARHMAEMLLGKKLNVVTTKDESMSHCDVLVST